MKKLFPPFVFILFLLLFSCAGSKKNNRVVDIDNQNMDFKKLILEIDGKIQDVVWDDNRSVEALKNLAKDGLEIFMSNYGGFEQVGELDHSLPCDDKRMKTTFGDICLYSSDRLVIFYGSNSWSYTHLGKINLSEKKLKELLDRQNIDVKLYRKIRRIKYESKYGQETIDISTTCFDNRDLQ